MPWYYYFYYCVLALGIILGALRFQHLSVTSRWFLALLVITFLVELTGAYAAKIWHSNLLIYRIFAPIQMSLITAGFWVELIQYRKWLIIGLIMIWMANIIETIWHWDNLTKYYPTLPKAFAGVLTIAWSLLFLYLMLEKQHAHNYKQYPLFWFSTGWLLFSILTLINLSALNYIYSLGENYLILFEYIRAAGNIFLYSLFGVAFLTLQRQLRKNGKSWT